MENNNIVMLRHHPMNVLFTNPFYTNQCRNLDEYTVIDATSRNKDKAFIRQLSPFFIGPVKGADGAVSITFENFWQYGKVYPCHVDGNGDLTEKYFEWRNRGYADPRANRHPNDDLGFKPSDCLYFAFYNPATGEYDKLNYLEARKKIYFTEYAKLVADSDSFRTLKEMVDRGEKIALVDFDAYNYLDHDAMVKRFESFERKVKKTNLTVDDFLAIKTLKDVVNCSFLQAGHGFVLKALLQGDLEVVDGAVVDHSGLLE